MNDDTRDVVPQPDPTRLTTAALLREIASLRELLQAQIGSLEAKLDAADVNHAKLHGGEAALRGEQHDALTRELQMLDRRLDEALQTRDKALDVALVTMKEKVTDLKVLLDRQVAGLESRVAAVQERADQQIESLKEANSVATGRLAGKEHSWQQTTTIVGLVVAALVLAAMIIIGVFT